MPAAKKLTADAFCFLQIVLSLVSGGSQFHRLLTTSQGVNVSWLASWLTYLLINLVLTIRAHRSQPSRVTLQDRPDLYKLEHGHRRLPGSDAVDGAGSVGFD